MVSISWKHLSRLWSSTTQLSQGSTRGRVDDLLRFRYEHDAGADIVYVEGELDISSTGELQRAVANASCKDTVASSISIWWSYVRGLDGSPGAVAYPRFL